jgi:hypothetical protein
MHFRQSILAVVALVVWSDATLAGPIEFNLTPTGIYVPPGAPAISDTLVPLLPPGGTYAFDPASGKPTVVSVVDYVPARIPQPRPIDIHPDGTTHWNNEGYFRVDMRLTDVASLQHVDFSVWGYAHLYNNYGMGQWSGQAFFWFGNFSGPGVFALGGNNYTIWGQNTFTTDQPALSVWVGPNAPVSLAPEPGTLLLVAIGFVPLLLSFRVSFFHASRGRL